MATYVSGFINPAYPSFDTPPTANPDTATVSAEQSVSIDVLSNDTDPDAGDTLHIGEYSDATYNGQVVGTVAVVDNQLIFTATDPDFDTGTHTVSIGYTAADEWGAESAWTTVQVTVTGNATPGQTLYGNLCNGALVGGAGNDTIYGGLGNHNEQGGGGSDYIVGGIGCDTLNGGSGNDTLIGGIGANTFIGGTGDDTMTAGLLSKDTFVYALDSNTGSTAWGHDTIYGFNPLTDKIQFSPFIFSNYSDVMAHAQQVGCDVVITSHDGQSNITLHDTSLRALHSSDFIFA